jgi:hypothetical protein
LHQHKDNVGEKRYSMLTMSDFFDVSEMSVENILESAPKAVHFFLDWHAACVGCGFARFCTLKDVINTYHLDEKSLLDELTKIGIQKH